MSTMELIALSIALGTDLFSVSIPIGMNSIRSRTMIRAALVFAIFHIVMILFGYYLGYLTGNILGHLGKYHLGWSLHYVRNLASIIGALVLIGLGLHLVWINLLGDSGDNQPLNPLSGFSLIALAFSVSIDALAAGLGMGMLDVDLVKLSIILGTVIFCIALTGLLLGRRISGLLGEKCSLLGAVVLIYLGVHLMINILV